MTEKKGTLGVGGCWTWTSICAALSINFIRHNFCCIHTTLRVTPAMPAHVTQKLWNMEDVVQVVEEWKNATAS